MDKGQEALNRAACFDDLEYIASADPALVNRVDDSGKTALFYALYRSGATTDDNPSTVDALLRLGADPNQRVERRDGSFRSPLHQAAIRSLSNVAHSLADAGADIHEPGMIHGAAEGGLTWLVERCLEGTPVDQRHNGVTPLHDACYSGTAPLVELLLERGADASAVVEGGDWGGVDNLKFAIVGNNPVVVAQIVAAGVVPTLDHLRFALDSTRTWAPPLEEIEDALVDLLGGSLSSWADGAPFLEVVRGLGDVVDDADACRAIAGEVAEHHGRSLLKQAPMGPDAAKRVAFWERRLGLSVAPEQQPQPIDAKERSCEVLTEEQAIELAGLELRAALQEAARNGDAETLRVICRHHDPNLACAGTLDALSAPPLYVAAKNGEVDAVRALLECGADPLRTAADNKTAYHVAGLETRVILRQFGPVWSVRAHRMATPFESRG